VPAVVGDIKPPESLIQSAVERKTPLVQINHDFNYRINPDSWEWSCKGKKQREYLSLPVPALKGKHQYRNASNVLMVLTEMEDYLPVNEQSIHQGLLNIQLKGRFQLINGDIPVLLDVAHNPQAVRALRSYLDDSFSGKKIHAVFSMMRDKDIKSVINIIKPIISQWFVTPLNSPRAARMSFMQDCFRQCDLGNVAFTYKDFSEAYSAAEKNAKKGDLILIFGSFFLVSEYLSKIENI
jgi:dihydrofolate synthase/folylpolyglutamate synthase